MLKITRYREIVTPESAEQGDCDQDHPDHGAMYEDREMSFRDVVRELQDFAYTSNMPCTYKDALNCAPWAVGHSYINDFADGSEATESLHCDTSTPRARRYWALALKAAGLVH